MKKLFVVGLMALGAANADLIPNLQTAGVTCVADASVTSVSGQSTGNRCTWNYDVALTHFSQLNGSGNGDEFVVIYDFDGYIDGSISVPDANWAGSVQSVGPVGIDQNLGASRDTAITNLVWTYVGAGNVTGPQVWSGFTAQSVYGDQMRGWYTGQTWKSGDDDGPQGNIGPTKVPMAPPQGGGEVPEPMSMMLLGGGLAGLGLLRLRKK